MAHLFLGKDRKEFDEQVSDLKKTVKKFVSSVEAKKKDEATDNLKSVYKKFDKAVKRNILKKNTAARRKSRYSKLLTSIK